MATERPLSFADVGHALSTSCVADVIVRAWARATRAMDASQTAVVVAALRARVAATKSEDRIGVFAWAVGTAATVHVLMLLSMPRGQFPYRVTMILPAFVAVVALVVFVRRRDVARALADRRSREL